MQTDYLIIGQGISGTFLSYYLQKAGKSVIVIDESNPYTASKVASGIINPVTGRRIVKTWMIDEVMPFAVNIYQQLEKELSIELITQCNVLDFHPSLQMKEAFVERMKDENHLKSVDDIEWKNYFNFYYGVGEIDPCWLIDLNSLLNEWRNKLQEQNVLIEEKFDIKELDTSSSFITYKNIKADKIIFCDGINGVDNPFFQLLPYSKNKGEALIVEINDLPRTNIFKQGINIVPWKEDLFWIGSSYEWNYTNSFPSEIFKKRTEAQLQLWLKLPYKIIDHIASERPANLERRPFVGLHPLHQNIGILNGMGTKGCSLAPFFAHQFTQHLMNGETIEPLADVKRFSKVLSR